MPQVIGDTQLKDRQFPVFDLGRTMLTAAEYKNAMARNALAQEALQERRDTRNALSGAFGGGAPGTDPYQAGTNALLRRGNVEGASKVAQIGNLFNKSDPEAKLKMIDGALKMFDYGSRMLEASTLENYPAVRERLIQLNPDFAPHLPDPSVFAQHPDPQGDFAKFKEYAKNLGMSQAQKLEAAKFELEKNTPKAGPMIAGPNNTEQQTVIQPGNPNLVNVGQPRPIWNPETGTPKPSFDQNAAIEAFKAKNGREPTKEELPTILSEAKNQMIGVVPNPNASLTGEDAMQNYDPKIAEAARRLVRAQEPYPSSFALKTPYWQSVLNAARDLDPEFNATQYGVRKKVRESFTSGKDANTRTSINTLVGHLDSLNKSAQALDNRSFTYWNAAANKAQAALGNPRLTKFNMDLGAVESELASVFKQTGATDQEIKAWRERINSSQSPAQLKTAITEAVELMGSRLRALRSKYEAGMGPFGKLQILDSKSRGILSKIVGPDAVNALEPEGEQSEANSSKPSPPVSDNALLKFYR